MYEYKATVTNVVDGDTIDVVIDLGFQITMAQRVRLARIDACEIRKYAGVTDEEKAKGIEGKQYLESLLLNHKVRLVTVKDKGKYGRYIADVFLDEDGMSVNVNDEMVKLGYAVHVKY